MERFTISLEDRLAREFDALIERRGYVNRSEAVRDLLRAELDRTQREERTDGACVACLSYVFNHHELDLAQRITDLQHAHHDLTISTMHAHLDHDHCLETVILRGRHADVQRFCDAVIATRGIHHGKANVIAVDVHEPHAKAARSRAHDHAHVHVKPST